MSQIKNLGTEKTTPVDTDFVPIQQADGVTRRITIANLFAGAIAYPEEFTHFHDQSIVVSGSALSKTASSSYLYNLIAFQGSPAINNSFRFTKTLKAGTYSINLLGSIGTVYGTLSLSVNGVSKFSDLVLYNGSTQLNVIKEKIITISDSGANEFLFSVSAKHASSTNYFVSITKIWGFKTA